MKIKPHLMIHCISSSKHCMKDILLQKISAIVTQHFPNASVALEYHGDYWKWENSKEAVYSVSSIYPIYVRDFFKIFPVTWEYSESKVADYLTKKSYIDESAIWSKNCMPNEKFLIPEVTWVHIYTWED